MLARYLAKRLRSFDFAFKGIMILLREPNAQLHLLASILVICAGWFLDISRSDWLWVIVAMAIVWIAEGLNTALEYVCDKVSQKQNPLIGKAKDVAAGAVLLAALAASAIGLMVFLPYLLN